MKLTEMLKVGQEKLNEKHAKAEKKKLGIMRGGSSGILTEDGKVFGTCMRMHYLRMKGISPPFDDQGVHVMFAAGLANEDIVAEILSTLKRQGYTIKQEEAIPVKWELGDEGVVTGRPDIVVYKADDEKVPQIQFGIELKNISSIWTARDVIGRGEPKHDHLIQSALYSWRLGMQHNNGVPIPYKLMYTNSMNWHIMYNKYITQEFLGRENICKHDDKGKPLFIKPGRYVYDLYWNDGCMFYKIEGTEGPGVKTVITIESLNRYFATLATLEQLPPPPEKIPTTKSSSYKACKYCDLADVCKKEHTQLDTWTDDAILTIKSLEE